jgi:broad specificity phosphatase PhoE
MSRTLLLVRHGETAWNREGRFQGHTDVPLSEVGRDQARLLRARLEAGAHRHLYDDAQTVVVTSDLRRAHETAELVFGGPGRALHVRRELREFCYGIFEGKTRPEIDDHYPGAMAAWLQGDRAAMIEGGESRTQVHARAHAVVEAVLAELPHRYVVVVGHGGVMRQLLSSCFADRSEPRNLSFANTAAHVIHVDRAAQVEPPHWSYGGQL